MQHNRQVMGESRRAAVTVGQLLFDRNVTWLSWLFGGYLASCSAQVGSILERERESGKPFNAHRGVSVLYATKLCGWIYSIVVFGLLVSNRMVVYPWEALCCVLSATLLLLSLLSFLCILGKLCDLF